MSNDNYQETTARGRASEAIADYQRSLKRLMNKCQAMENEMMYLSDQSVKQPRLAAAADHRKQLEALSRDMVRLFL